MSNLRDDSKLRPMKPTDVVLGADEQGCLVNFPPDNFSGSIPISIDTETGDGEELFTEPSVNDFLFKKLKSKDGSADVITDTDGNIDVSVNFPPFPDIPAIDYPVTESEDVGSGVSLRRDVSVKKIGVRTLNSNDFIITTGTDGSININSAGGGSNTNDWYLDINYTRPANWTPDETIDGIQLPKGTLNDPFKTFDEYLKKVIGSDTGSNANGAFSRINPRHTKTLQVLSDFETDKVLEVNNNAIYLRNGSTATYTGAEEYAYNTERLWDAMPKTSGILNRGIYCEIKGEGGIVNKFHAGAVCHKTSESGTTTQIKCLLSIIATGSGLSFIENENSATYTALTLADNATPFMHDGAQVKGSTQTPTTPILKFKGKNANYWGAAITGTKIFIQSNIQSFISVSESGSVSINNDELSYLVSASHIGYEKKLYTGLSGMTADETEILGSKDLFFKPNSLRNVLSSDGGSLIEISDITTYIDQRYQVAVNSIFKLSGASGITCRSSFKELGGGCAVSFIEAQGNGNSIKLNGTSQTSNNTYFVMGNGANTVNVSFINSSNNVVEITKKNVATLNINTMGTWSSIKSIPVNTGFVGYADNAAAVSAGYIAGMAYYNTTESAISIVI